MNDPNRALLERAVDLLRPLLDELVFVGGCATGLLITDPGSGGIRATNDVDVIAEVSTYAKYSGLSERLRALGFAEDTEDRILCRWRRADLVLDVMPADESVLGFTNRWFDAAVASARSVKLRSARIRAISAAYFLATKLEAFRGRGARDFAASHDLEDVITVIDGRSEIVEEVRSAEPEVRGYLATEFRRFLREPHFMESLPGLLSFDAASQARLPLLLHRLRLLSAASELTIAVNKLRETLHEDARGMLAEGSARGTLFTGGLAKDVANKLVGHLEQGADRLTRVYRRSGLDQVRPIVDEVRRELGAITVPLLSEELKPLRGLPIALKIINDDIEQFLISLPDLVAATLADYENR